MSSNPFTDGNPFDDSPAPVKTHPRTLAAPGANSQATTTSSGGSRRGSLNAGGLDAGALLAQQVAMRNGASGHAPATGSGGEKAARMFAASQAAAAEAEAHPVDTRRQGKDASAFESRERNARYSTIQSGGGQAMAFPMTDMVDAAAEKKIGLSFASLAVRDHGPMGGEAHAEEGVVVSQAQTLKQQPKQAQAKLPAPVVQKQAQTIDPWGSSTFGGSSDPFGSAAPAPSPVFRNPPQPQQQRQQPAPQQQAPQRAPAPASTLMDFDPLSFGDMSAQAKPQQAKPAAAADPWGALGGGDPFGNGNTPAKQQVAAPPAAKKKKPVVVESSDSSSSESEATDSDDEDEATKLAREKARKKAAKAAAELQAQRERERAEAVAYDNARKASIQAARRNSGGDGHSSASSAAARSREVDADDEDAQEVLRNETDHAKLQKSGAKGTYPKAVTDRWGTNPAEHWAYSKSKTRSKLLMPKVCVYWRFIWAGERHEVELFHSTVSGKRTVRCDGALVAQEKLFIDTGSRHDFTSGTGSRPCNLTVLICSSGSDYAYELFIGGTSQGAKPMRFYQALQSWLIELQRDPSQAQKLEPLSPTAINTVGSSHGSGKYR